MAILTGNICTDIVAVVVSLIAIVVVYFNWAFKYWSRKGVTTPPATFPFGNAKDIFLQKDTIGVHLRNVYQQYKSKGLKYCGYYFLTQPQVLVFDLDLIKSIMTRDFAHFTDHAGYINEEVDPLTGHVFAAKGLKWKNLRAKLTPTFTSGKMKMMFQALLDCSNELIVVMDKMVKDKDGIDVKEVMARFTTDVIGTCAFGIECNSLKNPDAEFRRYGKKIFETTPLEAIKIMVSLFFPGLLSFLRLPLVNAEVSKFFMNTVHTTVDQREKHNIVRKDFMHLLIQLKNNVKITDEENVDKLRNENTGKSDSEEGKTLNMNELAAQAFVFFLAGFETSSTTLTFCFYELVSNIAIQNKLRDEIKNVLEKHDGKLTYNAIMDMTYMDMCISETLRKHPAVPLLGRECTKDYTIPGTNVTIDKGTQILIPVLGIQRDPEIYPEPETFDPERFSPENKSQRHPYAWLPFGEGPRACIGLRFGLMQTKVALATLLANYRFSLNLRTKTPPQMDPSSVILTAIGGIWLNAEKISE